MFSPVWGSVLTHAGAISVSKEMAARTQGVRMRRFKRDPRGRSRTDGQHDVVRPVSGQREDLEADLLVNQGDRRGRAAPPSQGFLRSATRWSAPVAAPP